MTKPVTYEMYVLLQQIGNDDITAVPKLWELVFETPFDPKGDLNEIVKDLADELASRKPPPEPEPAPKAMTNEEFLAALSESSNRILEALFPPKPKKT